ncbi:MAG: DUF5020 family protein [Mediterranea sp.]|jgi:hypothetical protein|nr:DUF5020 family protein [Mediterranea sp.]
MKKTIFILLPFLFICRSTSFAQNIQLHYDFGRTLYSDDMSGRPRLTTTVETFHPDSWGNTFFFVDMDYTSNGIVSAYWEIARELQFWKGPFSAHVEYNGGLAKEFSFNNAYLVGPAYTYNNASFSKGFTLTAMYKYIQKHGSPNSFQLTGTWYINSRKGLYSFCGFADWWREKTRYGTTIFVAEPQFWVNLNKIKGINEKFNLSIGTEWEISNDFVGDGLFFIPTLALKWTL